MPEPTRVRTRPFRIDAALLVPDLAAVPERARQLEQLGFDGVFTFEGPHNPFLPLVLAAEHSQLELHTGVAIAFARTPMTVANLGWDLQQLAQGRLSLGLGSQIRAHVEARYSMPWGQPIARMREFVRAYHAIFDCWLEGERLDFRGEYYTHTLMPPLFQPGPLRWGRPPLWLAGVGPRMIALAGELADGLLIHPFHTRRYLEQLLLPALDSGLARGARERTALSISAQVLVVTATDEAELAAALGMTRSQVGFYASTPAYWPVLAAEGRAELGPELRELTRQGRWGELAGRVDDKLLRAVAVIGTPAEAAAQLVERYGGLAQRVALASPFPIPADTLAELLRNLDAGNSSS